MSDVEKCKIIGVSGGPHISGYKLFAKKQGKWVNVNDSTEKFATVKEIKKHYQTDDVWCRRK